MNAVDEWRSLAIQHIEHALPEVGPDSALQDRPRKGDGIFECGDHMMHGSVEGALLSAEQTFQQVFESLQLAGD